MKRYSFPTSTVSSLVREYGKLRDETSVLDSDVANNHRKVQTINLDNYARQLVREEVNSLLEEIVALGMGWSDIAQIIKVSVQAIRKWRNHEPITGDNRLKIARLLAFLKLLEEVPISDPVSWLEAPLIEGYTKRHIDLYKEGHAELLFELANLRIEAEAAMSELDTDWREKYIAKHEVFEMEDGQLSISRR
jgi:hypothetical protein